MDSHFMHGSEDIAHYMPRRASEAVASHDLEDLGRFMHGSEDVSHHHRWFYML